MISEGTQKQLLLFSGILTAVGAIVGAWTDIIKKITGLPILASWLVYAAFFFFGVWILFKWRTRHSRLLKPDALRLERDNAEHLVGRAEDINNLLQQCLAKQVVCLEGESGSGKSALVRAGLLPKLRDEKSVLPLLLTDRWVDDWDRSPFQALRNSLITSGGMSSDASTKPARRLSALADLEHELIRLNDEEMRTPLIVFDQFDDYQARNRERFLPNKTWLDPGTLRQSNQFWDMVARLLGQEKVRCLFVTRSDTAAGLNSVAFFGSVQALRLDRVLSPYIAELLTRLTAGTPTVPVIADPDAGWTKLRDRVIRDISEQNVILPQQLKIMLGGIQSLKWLNIAQYERVGGAAGIEAFYIEQQISGTVRKVGLDSRQVRAVLLALIDPLNPTKTWSRSKEDLLAATSKVNGQPVAVSKLDNALEELDRSELVRTSSDPESGRTAYRLDHDYLTRGVSAVERRANRWRNLLEDRARDFQNANTLWKKWKALLPIGTQCRLAWERMRGRFRYSNCRSYALISLARLPARMVSVLGISFIVIMGFSVWFGLWMNQHAQVGSLSFPKEIQSITDPDKIRTRTREFEAFVPMLGLRNHEEVYPLAGQFIETMQSTTNNDQMSGLLHAFIIVVSTLTPDEVRTLASSILTRIQNTADIAQLSAQSRIFAAILPQLTKPDAARALADPILQGIKGSHNINQRHALGIALAAVAAQLKAEEAGLLDGSIVEAIQGQPAPMLPADDQRRRHPKTGKPEK